MNPETEQRTQSTQTEKKESDNHILKRLAALLSVKSLVTMILTGVFAYQAVTGGISQDFMTIYAVIIAFYFGTQSQKIQDKFLEP